MADHREMIREKTFLLKIGGNKKLSVHFSKSAIDGPVFRFEKKAAVIDHKKNTNLFTFVAIEKDQIFSYF